MTWQIFGTKKCPDTRKTERFFKDRQIKFQFINLAEKGLSKGELNSVKASVPLLELIDTQGKEYERLHLKYMRHDIEEQLLQHPLLFTTPIVREGSRATVGFQPEVWKKWLS